MSIYDPPAYGKTGTIYDQSPQQEIPLATGDTVDQELPFTAYSVVVTNPSNQQLHIVGTRSFVPGNVAGFVVQLPGGVGRAQAEWAAQPGDTQPVALFRAVAVLLYTHDSLPAGIATTAVGSILSISEIAALAITNVLAGFNPTAGPFTDSYIMGWNWWVTNGAAQAQLAVNIKGDQTGAVKELGALMALVNGISSLVELLTFPIRVAKLLPGDTSYHVGIGAEAGYALASRGDVYLGS